MPSYFRQLRLPDIGCASYIIGGDGECVVVDPRWDAVAQYVGLARRAELEITAIVETHTHADHVSGATRLADRTGATILIHRNAEARYPHQDLDDGDEITAGPYRLQVLYTPGHSFDSISLLVRDTTGVEPARLLTGDTLFVGDVGRPDLHKAAGGPAELAGELYHSLHERLLALDDTVEVYPGHLAGSLCGKRIEPEPSTTIGRERRANPSLKIGGEDSFVADILADMPSRPPNMDRIVEINRAGAALARPEARHVSPAEAAAMIDEVTIVDGRDHQVAGPAHLAGAINAPISYGQFGLMVSWLVDGETPLLLVTADEEDLADAVDSLMVLGMTNPLYALDGGPDDWRAAGLPMAATPVVDVAELARRIEAGEVGDVIDVREASEVETAGTIDGARVVPYRNLRDRATMPPLREPVAVVCNSGNRSALGASLLERQRIGAFNVAGGTTAWEEAGRPIVRPVAQPA
ncbi:MAG TPA: MBL fold metallo-hydrolase [Thermomicrobiales bacterium]|nr:MBL fold metallo-hydrolase [Thermomicrobiales bacterium]